MISPSVISKNITTKRAILFTGSIYLIFYSVLSWRFYIQRCSFIDGPYMLINLVNNESFFFPMKRFAFILTEWLPLILVKTGTGFESIAMSFSLSYPLLLILVFLSCILILRNHWLALGFALISCLAVKYTFYYLPLEWLIGICVAVLAVGWSWQNETRFSHVDILVAFLLGSLIVFSHPLAILSIIFSFGIIVLEKRKIIFGRPGLLFAAAISIFCLKLALVDPEPYEIAARDSAARNLENFFNLQTHSILLKWMLTDYFWIPVTFAATGFMLILARKYLTLLWLVAFVVFFVAMVNCRNYDNNWQFYIEHYLYLLSFFIVLPVVRTLTEKDMPSKVSFSILVLSSLILTERGLTIYETHHFFDSRNQWQTGLIETSLKTPGNRLTICRQDLESQHLAVADKLPYETWFLSKMKFRKDAVISTVWGWSELQGVDSLTIIGTDLQINKLNEQYFHFPERAAIYYCHQSP